MSEGGEMAAVPMVGIVVVNYFGGHRTLRCLSSLEQLTWPEDRLAVALVDNGSETGFLDLVRQRYPGVRLVRAASNRGFGAGCNLGFAALRDCEHVALLNNDAIPDVGWLEPLVEALESDPSLGAVTPKVLLSGTFVPVELRAPTVRPGRGDSRALGVQVCGGRVAGVDVSDRMQLAGGFWGWEHDAVSVAGAFAWTGASARLHLPVEGDAGTDMGLRVELKLSGGARRTQVRVLCGGRSVTCEVGPEPAWRRVGEVERGVDVVNNAGVVLQSDGSASDRGYLEPDDDRWSEPSEVFAWSGAAVLLRQRFLNDVGGFDERYFLYYEDTDLSWRGRLAGWTYRFEPRSTVRHDHSATVGDRSALAQHLLDRNRLLLLTKCAPRPMARRAIGDIGKRIARAALRDVVVKSAHLKPPVTQHVGGLSRVALGYLRLAAPAARSRRALSVDERSRHLVIEPWLT